MQATTEIVRRAAIAVPCSCLMPRHLKTGEIEMLEMHNIRKVYRTRVIETHALENFSISVDAGV